MSFCSECGVLYDNDTIEGIEKHIYQDKRHSDAVERKIKAERELNKTSNITYCFTYSILASILGIVGMVLFLR